MRIIHLIRNNEWGGGEKYAYDLAARSVKEGDKVTIVSRGIDIVDVIFKSLPVEMVKMPLGGLFDFTTPYLLSRLIAAYPEDRVIIHVHTFKDAELVGRAKLLLKGKKDVKVVCTRHLVKKGKKSLRWRFIYNSIDSLIFVSDLAKDCFLSTNPPINKESVKVVHNGINIPDKYNSTIQSPANPVPILLFIGRLDPEKGIEVLLNSLSLIKDTPLQLRLVGTGQPDYIDTLKKLSIQLGVHEIIEWRGFVADVFPDLREADFFVLPSIVKESFGLSIIEAMSQGKPVISTDNGAQPEIITDGKDGILVPPADPEALASAIRKLASDPILREKLGKAAAETFKKKFSYEVFYKKVSQIYKEI